MQKDKLIFYAVETSIFYENRSVKQFYTIQAEFQWMKHVWPKTNMNLILCFFTGDNDSVFSA